MSRATYGGCFVSERKLMLYHFLAACCLINGDLWEFSSASRVNPPRCCPCALCSVRRVSLIRLLNPFDRESHRLFRSLDGGSVVFSALSGITLRKGRLFLFIILGVIPISSAPSPPKQSRIAREPRARLLLRARGGFLASVWPLSPGAFDPA